MKKELRNIYYIPILPITSIVVLWINYMILKNTPDRDLQLMSEEDYVEEAMLKVNELYYEKYKYLLGILATSSWILIVNWLFL